jgi:hypothetical protein
MRKLTERIKKGWVIRSAPLDLILAANGKPTGDQLREQLLREERERRKEEILGCAATCGGCVSHATDGVLG